MASSECVFRFFGLVGHVVPAYHSSQLRGPPLLKLGVDIWYSARLPIGSEASPHAPDLGTSLGGVSLPSLLEGDMPASKTLEMSLWCACSARSALSDGIKMALSVTKSKRSLAVLVILCLCRRPLEVVHAAPLFGVTFRPGLLFLRGQSLCTASAASPLFFPCPVTLSSRHNQCLSPSSPHARTNSRPTRIDRPLRELALRFDTLNNLLSPRLNHNPTRKLLSEHSMQRLEIEDQVHLARVLEKVV
jgi:hypothetical protein